VTPVKNGHFSPLRSHFDLTIIVLFETSTSVCAPHFSFAPAKHRCSVTLASLEVKVQSVL